MGEQFQDGSVCVANVRLFNCGEINVVDGGQYLFFQCILQCDKVCEFLLSCIIPAICGGDLRSGEPGKSWWIRADRCNIWGARDCGVDGRVDG